MTLSPCYEMLNVLCPMHVTLRRDGIVVNAGPTVSKLLPRGLVGQAFLDVFEIKRPREISDMDDLLSSAGSKLNIRLSKSSDRHMKGVVMPGPNPGEMTVNLSFGISVVDAIQQYNLTAADFAATDLTVEMLYLVEAKSAAMEASRQLNQRLQTARMEAEEQALTDTLTGLKNRRAMDQVLEQLLENRERFALMHIDLDFFKAVNDTMGHAAGDHVLQEVGRIMTAETREVDIVARIGGDEFVILIRDMEENQAIDRIANRIIGKLQTPIPFDGDTCRISGSVGTIIASDYINPTVDEILGDADAALYAAKHAGRGRHKFFKDLLQAKPKIA